MIEIPDFEIDFNNRKGGSSDWDSFGVVTDNNNGSVYICICKKFETVAKMIGEAIPRRDEWDFLDILHALNKRFKTHDSFQYKFHIGLKITVIKVKESEVVNDDN